MTTGDTLTLKPELSPEKFADEPVTYSTKDEKVATVSKKGKIKAASAGETTLTVKSWDCTYKATIKVTDPVVYTAPSTSSYNYSQPSKQKKKKTTSSGSAGYFDSGDDEHF